MEFSDSEMDDMIDFLDLDPRSAAVAVARQCLDQGYESLTVRQKAIYDAYLRQIGEAPPVAISTQDRPAPAESAHPTSPPADPT